MTRKLTESELEFNKLKKSITTMIRLKHSLLADAEINEVLPDKLDEFNQSLAAGELKQLKASLVEVLNGTNR